MSYFSHSTDTEQSSGKRQHRYSFLQLQEVSESDSEEVMLKCARFMPSQTLKYMQPFNVYIDSEETSNESDAQITNAQQCKFGNINIEMSDGETGNVSTTSAQPQSTVSTATCSLQLPITKHFPGQPKNADVEGKKTTGGNDSAQASESALPEVRQSLTGTYSLVCSAIALSNL